MKARVARGWYGAWARDSSVLVASQLGAVLAASILAVLVARELGPGDYGAFAAFFGLAQAFAVLVDLGLTTWLLRELSLTWAKPDGLASDLSSERSRILGDALGLSAVFGVVVVVSACLVTALSGTETETQVAILGLLGYTCALAVSFVVEAAFRAQRAVTLIARATFTEKTVLVGGVVLAVALDVGITGLAAAYLVAGVVRLLFDFGYARRISHVSVGRPTARGAWRVARAAFPIALNTTLVVMIVRLDVVIVASVSAVGAGYFFIGDRLLSLLLILPITASGALYPYLAKRPDRSRQAWRFGFVMAAPVALVTAVLIVLAPKLVPAIFGEQYRDAVGVVQILLLAAPAAAYSNAIVTSLFSASRERTVVIWTGAAMLVGTGLLVAGLLMHDATGAAWGYLARALLFLCAILVLSRRDSGAILNVHTVKKPAHGTGLV